MATAAVANHAFQLSHWQLENQRFEDFIRDFDKYLGEEFFTDIASLLEKNQDLHHRLKNSIHLQKHLETLIKTKKFECAEKLCEILIDKGLSTTIYQIFYVTCLIKLGKNDAAKNAIIAYGRNFFSDDMLQAIEFLL